MRRLREGRGGGRAASPHGHDGTATAIENEGKGEGDVQARAGIVRRVLRRRIVRRFGGVLLLVGVLSGLGLVLPPSDVTPPPLVFDIQAVDAQVPAGCPGGAPGPATPGTTCPDGSTPGQAPAGCPGGPPGPPVPGTTCPDGSVPAEATAPAGCLFGPPGPPEPGLTVCPDGSTPRDRSADRALRNILGLDDGSEHPLKAYDIGCDEGAWNAFLRKMWCAAQSLPFAIGKWFIGIGTEMLAWALEFRVAESLTPVASLLTRVYDASLVGPIGIRNLAWTVALFVGGWNIMRSRWANGAREIALTFLIAIFGGMVLANPAGYLEGSVNMAQAMSGAVLESVDGAMSARPAQDADAVRDRLAEVMRRSFVAEPYDLINWGESLTGECAAVRDEILDSGPWGDDDRPREMMRAAGCEEQADFNHNPSDERAAASLTVAVASVMITILMVAMAIAVFAAQITLVALFSVASLVWAVALFPQGRDLLWLWLSRLLWAVLITFASIFLLSWSAITVTAVLDATTDLSIVQRCLIAIVVVGVAYRMRSAVEKGVGNAAAGLQTALRGASSGRTIVTVSQARGFDDNIVGSAIAGGVTGYALSRRAAGYASRGVQTTRRAGAAVSGAGATVARAPGQTIQRATARSDEIRQRLRDARASAGRLRHPIAARNQARSAAAEADADVRQFM
jgi:hypothetical protein